MSSERKVCDSCNAVAHSDAEFCRECGTALPSILTNSSELLARAKIALARADYKDVLRACAAAKLLDPDNAEVSQIMAAAHTALDVLREQKPGERNAAHVQDSNPHRNKSNTRKRLHWGPAAAIAVIMIIVLGIIRTPNGDETSSTSSSNNSPTNQQSDRTGSNSPELSATKVSAVSATLAAAQSPTAAATATDQPATATATATAQPATATPTAAKEHGGSSIERVDIEARDEFGGTLLHMAAQKNSLDVARQLIENGAGIEAKNNDGDTPLHHAAESNSLDVATLLIDLGADIHAKSFFFGSTPLKVATNSLDVSRLLIDSGADIDAKDKNGVTPLHRAAHENSADFARLLIEHGANGANIEAKNDNGFTPLHYAAWNNSLDVVRVLIEHGANTDGVDLSWMK